jgi:amidase
MARLIRDGEASSVEIVDACLRRIEAVNPSLNAGWPVVVVRAGTSREGLPIGVQVVAAPWREDAALALARQIETAFDQETAGMRASSRTSRAA